MKRNNNISFDNFTGITSGHCIYLHYPRRAKVSALLIDLHSLMRLSIQSELRNGPEKTNCFLVVMHDYTIDRVTTSSPGPSPRSKWRSEKPLAKAAKVAPKIR